MRLAATRFESWHATWGVKAVVAPSQEERPYAKVGGRSPHADLRPITVLCQTSTQQNGLTLNNQILTGTGTMLGRGLQLLGG